MTLGKNDFSFPVSSGDNLHLAAKKVKTRASFQPDTSYPLLKENLGVNVC